MEQYYYEFDYSEENKLIYMDIFNEYTQKLECYIVKELNRKMDNNFNMEYFTKILQLVTLNNLNTI